MKHYYPSDYYRQFFISIDIDVSLENNIEYFLYIANFKISVILKWITKVPYSSKHMFA